MWSNFGESMMNQYESCFQGREGIIFPLRFHGVFFFTSITAISGRTAAQTSPFNSPVSQVMFLHHGWSHRAHLASEPSQVDRGVPGPGQDELGCRMMYRYVGGWRWMEMEVDDGIIWAPKKMWHGRRTKSAQYGVLENSGAAGWYQSQSKQPADLQEYN